MRAALRRATQKFANHLGIDEPSQGANQTGAASSQLLSSAGQLSESTTSLQAEIDGFLKSIAAAA